MVTTDSCSIAITSSSTTPTPVPTPAPTPAPSFHASSSAKKMESRDSFDFRPMTPSLSYNARSAWLHMLIPTRSLRARMSMCFGAVTLFLTIVLFTVVILMTRARMQADNGKSLAELAASTTEMLERGMFERLREVTNLAASPVLTNPNSTYAEKRTLMDTVQSSYTYYSWVGVVSPTGIIVVSSGGLLESVNASNRPVFIGGLKGPYVGDLHYALLLQALLGSNETEPLRFLDFSAPIYDANHTLIGVVCAHLNWVWARDMQNSVLSLDSSRKRGLEMFIFSNDSRMILGHPTYQVDPNTVLPLPWVTQFYNSSSNISNIRTYHWPTEKNISIIHSDDLLVGMARCKGYMTYRGMPWVLVLTMTTQQASASIASIQNNLIACGVVFWVIFSVAGWYLADQIARPLVKTSSVAKFLLHANDNPGPSSLNELNEVANMGSVTAVDLPRYLKDEVYTMCKSVNLLMRTIAEQRMLTDMLEQRVEERTEVLSEEIKCRKAMQAAAEEARRAAEAAEAGKSRFLANMSHEIRTPMNGILGTIQLLLDTKLSMEQLDYVLTMKHSADSLLAIINDILLFSKLEAKQFTLHSTVFRAEHLLEGVGGLLSSLVNEKKLGLYFLVDENLPQHVVGDVDRLQQILVNMVGNSLKFTGASGEVVVACSRTCSTCYIRRIYGSNDNSAFVHGGGSHICKPRVNQEPGVTTLNFEIRDSGCGMTETQMEQLFTPFYQADTSTTRAAGGTGLGLSICKQIVELFNGKIEVQSQIGNGTAFSFTVNLQLPNLRYSAKLAQEFLPRITTHTLLHGSTQDTKPRDPARVFVACESHDVSSVISSFMSSIGFIKHTLVEYSGVSNLEEHAQALQSSPKYDAIILYCVDVSDAEEKAQMLLKFSSGTQVVVVCPCLTQAVRKQLTSVGIRHLSPPLSEAKLRRYLAALLFGTEAEANVPPKSPTPERAPKIEILETTTSGPDISNVTKVLAVEDNLTNLKILTKYLQKLGAQFKTAKDGVEAVTAIKEVGVGYFDLILMDLHMPNMDGIQATAEIRKWEESLPSDSVHRHTIIALTADVMPGINEQCTAAGMDGYLSKPIDYSLLSNVVKDTKRCDSS